MSHLRFALTALLISACATAPAPVSQPVAVSAVEPVKSSPALEPLPLWPEVKHGTLPNGLSYYVLKHGKPEKRAFLWLAVNAGSVAEDDDQRGLAHFDEHMAFNGTAKYPKAEIVDSLEKLGMRFGADLNAYTDYDETVYQLEVPTDAPTGLSTGLDILHEWAGAVSYEPKEVDKERGVVLEELRLHKGVMQRVFDKHLQVELGDIRYAQRKTIGLASTLEKAPREALLRFYKDWYRPDLMAVIAVGDVDPDALTKQIAEKFGDLKAPTPERPRPSGGVPKADGTRVSIEADPELSFTSVQVVNLVPHRSESNLADFRRILTESLYISMFNERMALLARRADAPFAQAGGSVGDLTREIDSFTRGATVKGGKVEATLRQLLSESLRAEKLGFTQGELDRAQAILTRIYVQNDVEAKTSDSTAWAREITRHFFENEFMVGRTVEKRLALEILPTITLAELNTTASRFGGADNRVILISGPDPKLLPSRENVLDQVKAAESETLEAWKEKVGGTTLLEAPVKPGSIVKEVINLKVGTTEWTLSNGIRVVVKPTDYAVDSVLITGTSAGGLAIASDAQLNDARFANDMVSAGGVGTLDGEALAKLLAGKQVSARTSIEATTESVTGSASVSDLETMFQLLYLKVTRPRRDDEIIAIGRSTMIEQLNEAKRSPQFQFSLQMQEALTAGNPRARFPTAGDVEKLNVDKAFTFFNDRFADMSDFTFGIVGAASPEVLKPLVEKYLASLPGKGRKEKERDVGVRKVKGVVKKKFALEKENKAQVVLIFHGDETWSKDKQRDMFILGQVLSIRLRELLREDMGGVYGVGASGSVSRGPRQERTFTVSFGCDPERVDALIKAAFDEMASIAKNGIGQSYLDKVKAGFVRERETELRTNGFWLQQLVSSAYYGDDPSIVLDLTNVTNRITSANVQAAAKRYLDSKQYFEAQLVPAP